eukprot:4461782-Amphidinium_carterae.1
MIEDALISGASGGCKYSSRQSVTNVFMLTCRDPSGRVFSDIKVLGSKAPEAQLEALLEAQEVTRQRL